MSVALKRNTKAKTEQGTINRRNAALKNLEKANKRRRRESSVLSPAQASFVENYLNCGVATDAARQAGYTDPGVSGYQLLRNEKVKAEIDRRRELVLAESISTTKRVFRQHELHAFEADVGLFFNEDGSMKQPQNWTPTMRKMVRKFKRDRETGMITEFELEPRHPSLFEIAEFLKMHDKSAPVFNIDPAEVIHVDLVRHIADMLSAHKPAPPIEAEFQRIPDKQGAIESRVGEKVLHPAVNWDDASSTPAPGAESKVKFDLDLARSALEK
jgi:terminase small subunit-like protein